MQGSEHLQRHVRTLLWALSAAWLLLAILSVNSPTLSYQTWILWGSVTSVSAAVLAVSRTRKAFVFHVSAVVSYAIIRVWSILAADSGRVASIGVWTIISVKSMLFAVLALLLAEREGIKSGPVLD